MYGWGKDGWLINGLMENGWMTEKTVSDFFGKIKKKNV